MSATRRVNLLAFAVLLFSLAGARATLFAIAKLRSQPITVYRMLIRYGVPAPLTYGTSDGLLPRFIR